MSNIPEQVNIIDCPEDCDILQLGEGSLVYEKEHAYVGKFHSKKGDFDFELTEESLRHMAQETNRYILNGNKSNLPLEHTNEPDKNRGHHLNWMVKKDSKGRTGLFSVVQFRDEESAKLAKTAQTSIYAPPKYMDGAKNNYVRPIRHAALTDYPVIPGLDGFTPLAASLISSESHTKGDEMLMKDLAAEIGLELSDDVLSDEGKAREAISGAVAKQKTDLEKEIADIKLELSEYKKLNPPKEDPVKVSKAQIAMLRENRELKLSQLVEKGNILPCVKKNLEELFCGDATLTLSLSEDVDDNFNKLVDILRDNDSIKLSEVTGPQQTDMAKLLDSKTNPLLADAERRAGN